jgi:hypothetical protein
MGLLEEERCYLLNQFDSGDWDTERSVKHGRIEVAVLETDSTLEEHKQKCWEVDKNIIWFLISDRLLYFASRVFTNSSHVMTGLQ